MAEFDPQLLKGILSMVLLRIFDTGENYGYAVVVRLRELGFDGLNEGTVYPALARIESKGWLSSRLVASSSGPARKYYRITRAGQTELRRSERSWREMVDVVEEAMKAEGAH